MLIVGPRHLAVVAAFAALPLLAPPAAHADVLVTRAGTGTAGAIGDGTIAAGAQLSGPRGIARLADGSLLIADTGNNKIRKIAPDGTITTAAGSGTLGNAGDGGPANVAQLSGPRDVAVAADGISFYIADSGNNRIRVVEGTGTINNFAGTGVAGAAGDGNSATLAQLQAPSGLSLTAAGGLLIADTTNNKIRLVSGGIITSVAGSGVAGSGGDGAQALLATINAPQDVSALPTGTGFLIADTTGNKIRKVDAVGGTITSVAGTGTACTPAGTLCGDYGPAALANLNAPAAVVADPTGTGFLIADTGSNRVRRVSGTGTITTMVGSGVACATSTLLCGDAGPAALASLNAPRGAIDLPDGSLLVADSATNRLRARIPDAGGPAGATGPTGLTGADGLDGLDGAAGANGLDGLAGADGKNGLDGTSGVAGPAGPAGPAGTSGPVLTPVLTAAFASGKLTGRAARAMVLRIVLTGPAVVTVRVKLGAKSVLARRFTFKTGGRKRLTLGKLKAATYAVTMTATDGASQSVDRTALRIIPGR
ncbi:MAG TPA: hypothetical protein VNT55_24195 [Baekduia sp.]|nr:hypothetical protein [Baekduia sp.]